MYVKSYICREDSDGSYYGIFCLNKGWLEHNGAILIDNYTDKQKVNELLGLGDIFELEKNVNPDPSYPHCTNGERQEDVTIAYARDCGATKNYHARMIKVNEVKNMEFAYIYVFGQDGRWRYLNTEEEYPKLRDVETELNEKYANLGFPRPIGCGYDFSSREELIDYWRKQLRLRLSENNDDSLQEKLAKNTSLELNEFKQEILNKSPMEIYNNASRIRFYEYMNDYIHTEKFNEEDCAVMLKCGSNTLLDDLWNLMLDLEDFNIGNVDDANFLLELYAKNNFSAEM